MYVSDVPGLCSDHPRHREYGGGRDDDDDVDASNRNYRKQPLYTEVEPLNVRHSTHNYILIAAFILPKVFPWITLLPRTSVTLLAN